jgi:lysophospholipase L1-like esterase
LATDGATTATVLDQQLPRLARLDARPSLVTLTVGGNDVLMRYGDTPGALAAVDVVRHRVEQILDALAGLITRAGQIVVGTVYDPSDGTGDAARVGLPAWPEVVDILARLNAALRDVAAAHGARIAEIHRQFLGHGVSAGNPAQPDPRPANRALWYCNVIEPNAWGASAVRAAFWQALDSGVRPS